ncbi:MAG: hypothetical protein KOO62_02890 [candidate division Zixibacteria bacterium]|nr:hypothetical protein [candidate division Zixibacteria bacterium]
MSRRRILLICYYFPPLGGAGVSRPLALFKHLPECGWDCHVLTVKPVVYRAYEPELLSELNTSGVYRAGSHDPQRLMYLLGIRQVKASTIARGKVASDRFFPDSKVGWVRSAIGLGRDLLNNRVYHAIASTSPPMSSHLVARKLAREFSIPWVADFRDYWTAYRAEDFYDSQPRKIRRARKLLTAIKKETVAITAINDSIGEYVGATDIIYNSFDRDLARLWKLPPTTGDYFIGLLGTLNDIYPVRPLLRVLSSLRTAHPELFALVKMIQVGLFDKDWLLPQLEEFDLVEKFELLGFQKRAETIGLLSQTSLLYVGLPSVREKGFSTGRIYTMLSSGRPILAAVPPQGEIARLLAPSGNGFCYFGDTEDMAVSWLADQILQWGRGESAVRLEPDYARPYASDSMAMKFADVLDKL